MESHRLIAKVDSTHFLCYKDDYISNYLIQGLHWEADLFKRAETYLAPDSVILDIGANIGTWAVRLARDRRVIYAFEPYKPSFLALCGNLFLNNCEEYVIPIQMAVSDQVDAEKQIKFFEAGNYGGAHLVDAQVEIGATASARVGVTTIDSYLDLARLDFIKIDVEGHELEALRGSEATIRRFKPIIFFECWGAPEHAAQKAELIAYIESLGYKVSHIYWDDYEAIPL